MLKVSVVLLTLVAVPFVGTAFDLVSGEDPGTPGGPGVPAAPRNPFEQELLPGAPTSGPLPIGLAHLTHGDDWTIDPVPAGLEHDPVARADWLMNQRAAQGQTPTEWVDWAEGLNHVAPGTLDPDASLVDGVARIYAALGLPLDLTTLAAIDAQAAALDDDLAVPFAGVVDVVADAYEAQAAVAADIKARFPGFDPRENLMTEEQRAATAVRAEAILAALTAFDEATKNAWPEPVTLSATNDPPLFEDPEGLVILGGTGNGHYTRSGLIDDPVLLIEPSGDDVYENSAGGACPDAAFVLTRCNLLALSVVADAEGNDQYLYDGGFAVVQGAGAMGGLGILADAAGNDLYQAKMVRASSGPNLVVQYYFDGGGQGYGYFGQGYLLDAAGDDVYDFDIDSYYGRHAWALDQGFGGGGGLGVAVDGGGTDVWDTQAIIAANGGGFQGIYSQGTGFYGGVGIMVDVGGADDTYYNYLYSRTVDYYAQGFGAFGGVGIMYEDGGNDDYTAVEHGRRPWINPLLNCAYGTGSYGGLGVFVDTEGNDRYYGETINDFRGATIDNEGAGHPAPAYGLFMDLQGDDEHLMYVQAPPGQYTHLSGRGVVEFENIVGTYLDIGGHDVYAGPGADDSIWVAGADINTP